jgi:hypothetical protein
MSHVNMSKVGGQETIKLMSARAGVVEEANHGARRASIFESESQTTYQNSLGDISLEIMIEQAQFLLDQSTALLNGPATGNEVEQYDQTTSQYRKQLANSKKGKPQSSPDAVISIDDEVAMVVKDPYFPEHLRSAKRQSRKKAIVDRIMKKYKKILGL